MQVDLAASYRHYYDHLLPVWRALPEGVRGDVYLASELMALVPGAQRITNLGSERPVLVGGFDDLRRVSGHAILMEHGVGQSYRHDPDNRLAAKNAAYAGGEGRHGVILFLCPNEYAAGPNREANPQARVEVIGSPYLATLQAVERPTPGDRPVVAFGFHWPSTMIAESGTAWPHWIEAIRRLAETGRYEILGHAHPRMWRSVVRIYEEYGIEPVRDFTEIVARADIYCCDNSSTLFQWAAVAGPTVVLDSPTYRQNIHHGLRFWDCADVGPRIIEPAALIPAIESALTRRPWPGAEERLARVFPAVENPAEAAAAAIVGSLDAVVPKRKAARFPRVAP